MARVSLERHAELEAYWRFHHDTWTQGGLNQREQCELQGLPLKRFGNCRAKFKAEKQTRQIGLLFRRGGLKLMSEHMSNRDIGTTPGYIPSARQAPQARRNFGSAEKRPVVAETCRPGISLSAIARRYGITAVAVQMESRAEQGWGGLQWQ